MIISSIQESLDLHLLPANSVCLVPMNLGQSGGSVCQPHPCRPFELSPTPRAKLAPESHDVPDPATDGNRFDPLNRTNNLEIHGSILCSSKRGINLLQAPALTPWGMKAPAARRMLKKAVQQGRSERRGEAYAAVR
jgi:hypothetical protein